MEEQPIDNLFKRKLYDAEIKPRAATWAALDAKHNPKRFIPVWTYMAIAASLLIVGAFGWWAMQSQDGSVMPNPIAVGVQVATESTAKPPSSGSDIQLTKTDRMASATITEPVKALTKKRLHQIEGPQLSNKSRILLRSKVNSPMEIDTQNEVAITKKIETLSVGLKLVNEPLPEVAAVEEIQKSVNTPVVERTLIVSINVPTKVVSVLDIDDSGSHKTGFSGLLKKVKQIKDGDVFALSATKTNRRGLGKFYADVKESIKNNSAD